MPALSSRRRPASALAALALSAGVVACRRPRLSHHPQLGRRDLAKHQSQIDDFVVQHVDAIVVCPVDSKGIGPAIQRANAAKIPVFTADIAANAGR